jgi:DNA polymerase
MYKVTIDFETRSKVDIREVGAFQYSCHDSTEILCMAYDIENTLTSFSETYLWIPPKYAFMYVFNRNASFKSLMNMFSLVKGTTKKLTKKRQEEIENEKKDPFVPELLRGDLKLFQKPLRVSWPVMDLIKDWTYGIKILSEPKFLFKLIQDNKVSEIEAHNVFFEKCIWWNVCMWKHNFPKVDVKIWRCSAALAAAHSLPRSLDGVGKTLNLPVKKSEEGKLVMLQMVKPNITGGYYNDPDRFRALFEYCIDDVKAEKEISKKLGSLPAHEFKIWQLDQQINRRGITLDLETLQMGVRIIENYTKAIEKEMIEITNGKLENIRQTQKLMLFLEENGVLVDNVQKATVDSILQRQDLPDVVRRVLEIRQDLGQTSVSKYRKMLNMADIRGIARDQIMYYGAHSGRFSARGFQIHNFPRGTLEQSDELINSIRTGGWKRVQEHGNVMDVLSSCARGMVKAMEGNKFLVADFANIEGRVLGWVAKDKKTTKAFKDFDEGIGEDIYKLTYADSFNKDVKEVTKDERFIGKVATLALGYQGAKGAFMNMANAYGVSLPESTVIEVVQKWRDSHPEIVQLWYNVEAAAKKAIITKKEQIVNEYISYDIQGDFLYCNLPNSSRIVYYKPALEEVIHFGRPSKKITFLSSKGGSSTFREDTYGGKLVENLVQRIARDLLCEAMIRIDPKYPVSFHVHDEIVSHVPDTSEYNITEYEKLMAEVPSEYSGLPVAAEGFEAYRYRK